MRIGDDIVCSSVNIEFKPELCRNIIQIECDVTSNIALNVCCVNSWLRWVSVIDGITQSLARLRDIFTGTIVNPLKGVHIYLDDVLSRMYIYDETEENQYNSPHDCPNCFEAMLVFVMSQEE